MEMAPSRNPTPFFLEAPSSSTTHSLPSPPPNPCTHAVLARLRQENPAFFAEYEGSLARRAVA